MFSGFSPPIPPVGERHLPDDNELLWQSLQEDNEHFLGYHTLYLGQHDPEHVCGNKNEMNKCGKHRCCKLKSLLMW